MYRVLLERGAEKDLLDCRQRFTTVSLRRFKHSQRARARLGAASWPAASTTDESALVTTAFFMKLLTRFDRKTKESKGPKDKKGNRVTSRLRRSGFRG